MDLVAAGRFVIGGVATQAQGQFLYRPAAGVLMWDADGTGAGAAVTLASLTGAPALNGSELRVIA